MDRPGRFTPLLTGGYVFAVLFPGFALGPVAAVLAIGGWGMPDSSDIAQY